MSEGKSKESDVSIFRIVSYRLRHPKKKMCHLEWDGGSMFLVSPVKWAGVCGPIILKLNVTSTSINFQLKITLYIQIICNNILPSVPLKDGYDSTHLINSSKSMMS